MRYLGHENSIYDDSYLNYLNKLFSRANVKQGLALDYGCGPTKGLEGLIDKMSYNNLKVESYDPLFFPKKSWPQKYDLVYASECFEHFYSPAKEITFIKSLLKPKGTLAVSTQLYDGKDFKSWHYFRDPTHVVFYSEKTILWIADRFGFKISFIKSPHIVFTEEVTSLS